MSYTKSVTIWCDGEDDEGLECMQWAQFSTSTVREARVHAGADGWAYRGGKDLCPECGGE